MEPIKRTLFKREQQTRTAYRIPALIYLSEDKTYLAFAEKRSSMHDEDALFLVMRKGKHQHGSIQWSPTQELSSAVLPDHRTMCPCPVYERNSKTIFLFFICVKGRISEQTQIKNRKNEARLCYVTSKDNGAHWSEVKDLTDSVIGEDEITSWATFGIGPGHGIQMESGKLVIPAYVYYIHQRSRCLPCYFVQSHAFCFYSDDRGEEWKHGEFIQAESCECEMTEIVSRNGRSHLYCNARNTGEHRVEAVSHSTDFNESNIAPKLVEQHKVGCQGSVIGFPVPESYSLDTKTWLLFSHPAKKSSRGDLQVYLNRTPLKTKGWEKLLMIHHGPCGYSDLAHCENENFAALIECGTDSEYEIAFVDFHLNLP
ncbi:hypothetical protein AAFF_G00312950 [Aldrovandia affinis]|uniref:exo-alpha-sialidase n=1 Tax=Aldrovandia affinis TaxID=143900 RepID=A0AAD7SPC8_9TELE|nr:hypothetical protein AAFF_G00312950 [Aldrovandia affinis]